MNTHLELQKNTLNIDVEVTLRGLNMLIEEIDCVLAGAGDEIADCQAAEEGGFSAPGLKEFLVFEFCFPSSLHPRSAASLPLFPTNQVYQSLKLMNGPPARLFITMRGLSRSAPSSVFSLRSL